MAPVNDSTLQEKLARLRKNALADAKVDPSSKTKPKPATQSVPGEEQGQIESRDKDSKDAMQRVLDAFSLGYAISQEVGKKALENGPDYRSTLDDWQSALRKSIPTVQGTSAPLVASSALHFSSHDAGASSAQHMSIITDVLVSIQQRIEAQDEVCVQRFNEINQRFDRVDKLLEETPPQGKQAPLKARPSFKALQKMASKIGCPLDDDLKIVAFMEDKYKKAQLMGILKETSFEDPRFYSNLLNITFDRRYLATRRWACEQSKDEPKLQPFVPFLAKEFFLKLVKDITKRDTGSEEDEREINKNFRVKVAATASYEQKLQTGKIKKKKTKKRPQEPAAERANSSDDFVWTQNHPLPKKVPKVQDLTKITAKKSLPPPTEVVIEACRLHELVNKFQGKLVHFSKPQNKYFWVSDGALIENELEEGNEEEDEALLRNAQYIDADVASALLDNSNIFAKSHSNESN